jgi:hypothetical protein
MRYQSIVDWLAILFYSAARFTQNSDFKSGFKAYFFIIRIELSNASGAFWNLNLKTLSSLHVMAM